MIDGFGERMKSLQKSLDQYIGDVLNSQTTQHLSSRERSMREARSKDLRKRVAIRDEKTKRKKIFAEANSQSGESYSSQRKKAKENEDTVISLFHDAISKLPAFYLEVGDITARANAIFDLGCQYFLPGLKWHFIRLAPDKRSFYAMASKDVAEGLSEVVYNFKTNDDMQATITELEDVYVKGTSTKADDIEIGYYNDQRVEALESVIELTDPVNLRGRGFTTQRWFEVIRDFLILSADSPESISRHTDDFLRKWQNYIEQLDRRDDYTSDLSLYQLGDRFDLEEDPVIVDDSGNYMPPEKRRKGEGMIRKNPSDMLMGKKDLLGFLKWLGKMG